MVTYGDRPDEDVCTCLKAIQHGLDQALTPPSHSKQIPPLATLAACADDVAVLLRRLGLQPNPKDTRPSPAVMIPQLHVELRNVAKEQLSSLSWGKGEVFKAFGEGGRLRKVSGGFVVRDWLEGWDLAVSFSTNEGLGGTACWKPQWSIGSLQGEGAMDTGGTRG